MLKVDVDELKKHIYYSESHGEKQVDRLLGLLKLDVKGKFCICLK